VIVDPPELATVAGLSDVLAMAPAALTTGSPIVTPVVFATSVTVAEFPVTVPTVLSEGYV
jgi:hypothetical protein